MKLTPNKKVQYDDFSHTYLCEGKVLQGVTTLMKKHGLSANYSGISPITLDRAATRGSAIHSALEAYDKNEPVVIRDIYHEWINEDGEIEKQLVLSADELQDNIDAYKKLDLKTLASEFLISDNKTTASSIDKVLSSDKAGCVDLGDIKTTSTLHIKALEWQLGIYKYLLEKQCKTVKVDKCYGIHIRKGTAKIVPINPVSEDKVKALLDAEAKGIIYVDNAEAADTSLILTAEETQELIATEIKLSQLDATIKELKKASDSFKERIYGYMLENNLDEMTCGEYKVKLKRPYQTTRVDSKKLKEFFPDVAGKVSITSEVKGSITINLIKND